MLVKFMNEISNLAMSYLGLFLSEVTFYVSLWLCDIRTAGKQETNMG